MWHAPIYFLGYRPVPARNSHLGGRGLNGDPGSGLLLPYRQGLRQGRRWWMSGGMLNLVIAVLVIILLVILILQFV